MPGAEMVDTKLVSSIEESQVDRCAVADIDKVTSLFTVRVARRTFEQPSPTVAKKLLVEVERSTCH